MFKRNRSRYPLTVVSNNNKTKCKSQERGEVEVIVYVIVLLFVRGIIGNLNEKWRLSCEQFANNYLQTTCQLSIQKRKAMLNLNKVHGCDTQSNLNI